MAKKEKLSMIEKHPLLIIFILAVIMLSLPYMLRISDNNTTLIGSESYLHARISQTLLVKGEAVNDLLITGGRPFITNPYHHLLSNVSYFTGIADASKYVPFILGLISVFLMFSLLKHFKLSTLKIFLIMLVFVLSPGFIYVFTFSNPHALLLFLALLGFNLFFCRQKRLFIFSIPVFFLMPYFSILISFIAVILLLSVSLQRRRSINRFIVILTVLVISASLNFFIKYSSIGFPEKSVMFRESFSAIYLSSLGSLVGFDIFMLFLAVMGFFYTWGRKQRLMGLYLSLLILLIAAYTQGTDFNIYANLIFSFFAGIAFYRLVLMRWDLEFIEKLTILLIILGLVFSGLSYVNRISSLQPDDGLLDSLAWLKEHSEKGSIILCPPQYGYWVEFGSERKVILDSAPELIKDSEIRFKDLNELFFSKELEITRDIIEKYNISYLIVDNEMKNGLIWSENDEGLLFLLRNNETFKKEYSHIGIDIWKITIDTND